MPPVIIHPGLYDSSSEHWQSHWGRQHPDWLRIQQLEWAAPVLEDWVQTLDATIRQSKAPPVLVCHSAGCIAAVARVARYGGADIAGALLVAPADAERPSFPTGPAGFSPVPRLRLPFPSIVVASDNDPYARLERTSMFAAEWGSQLIVLPNAGHINADAGFGEWPEGMTLLQGLLG
ncbi:MAG: alpha/beta hydrolase [Burkholderiales bacterium]|nr:alpha/beta hydrolase [Burkholderiales bacterium]